MRRPGLLRQLLAGAAAGPSVTPDLRDLSYGPHEAQTLDVYRPAAAAGDAPVILYVHGGGWQRGDKGMPQMVNRKAPHWVSRGAVFVSINYRMLPEAEPIAQAGDVALALAFVQANASAWGGDARRVSLVGHSAGAHLAALLCADPSLAAAQGAAPWRATVCVDSAALDIDAIMRRPHFPFYDPVFGTDPQYWLDVSPTHRLRAAPATPMLLVCSSLRGDSLPAAEAFAEKARGFGGRVEVIAVAMNHRDLNDRLGEPGNGYTEAVDGFLEL